ncbi:uncharacterized protein LOC135485851 isoform X2 [Lineus longissimus]|uniref:uncharacterized protein LOC135485851 isoform X2 n=1 Tax=Lineus longissimus TaxID=88925 RepID=UPI00315DD7B4
MVDHSSLVLWNSGAKPCIQERQGERSRNGSDRTESKVATCVLSSEPDSDTADSEDSNLDNQTYVSTTTDGFHGDEESLATFTNDCSAQKRQDIAEVSHKVADMPNLFRNRIFSSTTCDSSDLSPRKIFSSTSDSSDILANGSLSDDNDEAGHAQISNVQDEIFEPVVTNSSPKLSGSKSVPAKSQSDIVNESKSPKSMKTLKRNSLIFYGHDLDCSADLRKTSQIPRASILRQNSRSEYDPSHNRGKVAESSNGSQKNVSTSVTDSNVNGRNDFQDNAKYDTDIFRGKIQDILDAKAVQDTYPVENGVKGDVSGRSPSRGRRKPLEQILDQISPNHNHKAQTMSCDMNMGTGPSKMHTSRRTGLFNGEVFLSTHHRNSSGKKASEEVQCSIGMPRRTDKPQRDGISLIPKLDLNMKTMPCALSSQSFKGNMFPAEFSRKESRVPRLNGSHSMRLNSQTIFPNSRCDKKELRGRSSSVVVTTLCNTRADNDSMNDREKEWEKGRSSRPKLQGRYRSHSLDNVLDDSCDLQNSRYAPVSYFCEPSSVPKVGKSRLDSGREGRKVDAWNSVDGRDILSDDEYDVRRINADEYTKPSHERRKKLTGYDVVSGKTFSHAKAEGEPGVMDLGRDVQGKRKLLKDPKNFMTEHHLRAFSQAVTRSDVAEDVEVDSLNTGGSEPVKDNWILKSKDFEDASDEELEVIELRSVPSDRKRSLARTKSEAGHFVTDKISKSGMRKESQISRSERLNLNRSRTFCMSNNDMIEDLRQSKIELSGVSKLAELFWPKKGGEKNDSVDFCQNKTHDICRYLQKYRSDSAVKADKSVNRDVRKSRKTDSKTNTVNKTDGLEGKSPVNEYELQVVNRRGSYPLSELPVDLHRQRKKHRRQYTQKNRPASEIKDSVFGDLTESQTDLVLEKLSRKSAFLKLKDIDGSDLARDRWRNVNERLTPQPRRKQHNINVTVSRDLQKRCESLEMVVDGTAVSPELRARRDRVLEAENDDLIPDHTPNMRRKDYHGSFDNILDSDLPKHSFHRQQDSCRSIRRNHAMRRSRWPSDQQTSNQECNDGSHGLVYKTLDRRASYDCLLDPKPKSLHKTFSVPNMSLKPKLVLSTKSVSPAHKSYESASGSNTSSPDPTPKRSVLRFFQSFSRADKETPGKRPLKRAQTFTHTHDRVYRARSHSDQSFTASAETWTPTIDELERNPVVGRKVSFLRKFASEQMDDISKSVEDVQNQIRSAVRRIQSSFEEEGLIELDTRQPSTTDTTGMRNEECFVQGSENQSEELVTRLLEDAMESDVHTKADGLEDSSRSNFEYDKYGFCKTALLDEEENHLVARARRLQKDSEDITSTIQGSDYLTSLRVKWENYFVNLGTRELQPCVDLKILIRQGIPYDMKEKVWKAVINFRVGKMREIVGPSYYCDLLSTKGGIKRYNPAAKQIELDLLRTLPNNKHYESLQGEGIPRLRRILQAYSCHNPVVGYCQGLNRLVAIALLFLNEEDAFWCLVCIVDFIMPQDYYSKTLIASQADQRVLKDLISEKLPRFYAHLDSYEVDMSLFTFNWFLTVFVDNIPVETFLRIWDDFLYEGTKVLFRFAIAFFKYAEEDILALKDHMAIHKYLRVLGETMLDCRRLSQIAFHDLNPFPMKSINTKRSYYLLQVKKPRK